MSLEKIEKYIGDLEAIKNYDDVVRDRDEALKKLSKLENKLSTERRLRKKAVKERDELKKQFREKERKVNSLKESWKLKHEENQKLKSRNLELEQLKAMAEDKTLGEAEKLFLQAKEKEIRERAEKSFNSMKAEWEKSEKPKEVLNQAIRTLKSIIENLRNPKIRLFLKDVLEAGLPKKVEELIKSDVDKRLNEEFQRRVEEKSSQKAREKLNRLSSVEWPKWLRANVEPRTRELEARIMSNSISLLKGPWTITCDKCGTIQSRELTPKVVENLLRDMPAIVECNNPNCRGLFGRYKIRSTLEELISQFITPSLP